MLKRTHGWKEPEIKCECKIIAHVVPVKTGEQIQLRPAKQMRLRKSFEICGSLRRGMRRSDKHSQNRQVRAPSLHSNASKCQVSCSAVEGLSQVDQLSPSGLDTGLAANLLMTQRR